MRRRIYVSQGKKNPSVSFVSLVAEETTNIDNRALLHTLFK